MSGRKAQKVFKYTKDGVYIKSYDCINDFRKEMYPEDIAPRPIFTHKVLGQEYHRGRDGSMTFKVRTYRDDVKYMVAIIDSEYCRDIDKNKPIEVLNIKQEVIAEFKNVRLLTKLMPHISDATIYQQLNRNTNKSRYSSSGLFFRYKK